MASQYEKRKVKSPEALTAELQAKREKIRSKADEATKEETKVNEAPVEYTQSGFDVFSADGGKTYQVAEIKYNPETGEAKVVAQFDITRLVALQYANQKNALNSLKTRKRVTKENA